jgi:hypothetical protein
LKSARLKLGVGSVANLVRHLEAVSKTADPLREEEAWRVKTA